jgi:LmbE family N-acetylglucosaminyl deacetylase
MNNTAEEEGIRRVLGVFAHPDDPEFFAGATFARWAAEGAEITFLMATSGDKGSAEPDMTHERLIEIREEEQRRAAAALGVNEVIFLRYRDGELAPTLALRRDITRVIRQKKPDVVVTTDPLNWYSERSVNHPDHRAIGEATLAAVYPTARDRLNFIELERDEGLDVHKTGQVYIAGASKPNKKVDVSDYIEKQINALREHKSQISDIDALAERIREWKRDPESPDEFPRHIESFHVVMFQR